MMTLQDSARSSSSNLEQAEAYNFEPEYQGCWTKFKNMIRTKKKKEEQQVDHILRMAWTNLSIMPTSVKPPRLPQEMSVPILENA